MADDDMQRWVEYRVRIPALEGRFQYGHWDTDLDGAERNAAHLRESGHEAIVERREVMTIRSPWGPVEAVRTALGGTR